MTTRRFLIGVGACVFAGVAIACLAGAAIIYAGAYNVAADAPHSALTYWLAQTVRDRSVEVRAQSVGVPADLTGPRRIAEGAGLYAEMCSGCHLAPGMEETEISQGLYPRAPALSKGTDLTPSQEFWVIKHGIKMTGMAAWGRTHSDTLIWDMVAFLQKLPTLSADNYQAMLKSAPESHEEMMDHQERD